MPILNYPFGADGPCIEVRIGVSQSRVSAYQLAKLPVPEPVQARFLIDTGSDVTLVEAGLLGPLVLVSSGVMVVNTPSTGITPVQLPRFDVSLTLLHPILPYTVNTVSIAECPAFGSDIKGLLGRDVLSHVAVHSTKSAFSE